MVKGEDKENKRGEMVLGSYPTGCTYLQENKSKIRKKERKKYKRKERTPLRYAGCSTPPLQYNLKTLLSREATK